jgi:hypothetical protein
MHCSSIICFITKISLTSFLLPQGYHSLLHLPGGGDDHPQLQGAALVDMDKQVGEIYKHAWAQLGNSLIIILHTLSDLRMFPSK